MQEIQVTREQFDRIETAWAICSHNDGRKAAGAWAKTFRDCVAEVIGCETPEVFKLAIVEPEFKVKVNGQYRDSGGNVWVVLRTLPGGQADMKRVDRARFCLMRYCDIRANMTPA